MQEKSTWQASATCDKLYRIVWVFWLGGVTQKVMSARMRHAQLIYTVFVISLFNSVWNCRGAFAVCGAWWKAELVKMTVQIVVPNPAWIAKPKQCEFEMSAWNTPTVQRWNGVKICEKHLKNRCLVDVSHNTSSSSDTVSCLSSIHMLMLNQAIQSGSISNHFFFFSFPAINLPWREIKA